MRIAEWLHWLGTLSNAKAVLLVVLFSGFVGVIVYVYGSRARGRRLESYKYIPFMDEAERLPERREGGSSRESHNERTDHQSGPR